MHAIVHVEVFLPFNLQGAELYLVQDKNVDPGSACPTEEGNLVPSPEESFSIPLVLDDGIDTILVLCAENIVVAQSFYLFQSPSDFPGNVDRQWYQEGVGTV